MKKNEKKINMYITFFHPLYILYLFLEFSKKSLCPKENVFIPNSSKKLIPIQESKLEMNCVPRDQEVNRTKQSRSSHRGNLNVNSYKNKI
ncbi:hypothetical protein [Plasmodium yoelii yoelii]|uniref:Uncharacterized protein n=1 Tax=Plasmodium yoelii yoelii TaxID=73239 RepID=Q7RMX4_PLAYO|nr:hypothetical protein [Plasmodium yoelii yoelii]